MILYLVTANGAQICALLEIGKYFYRPQTKLRKGNVFTSVCQEFCSQGEVYTSPWADTLLRADTPPPRWLLQRTVRILLECILVD